MLMDDLNNMGSKRFWLMIGGGLVAAILILLVTVLASGCQMARNDRSWPPRQEAVPANEKPSREPWLLIDPPIRDPESPKDKSATVPTGIRIRGDKIMVTPEGCQPTLFVRDRGYLMRPTENVEWNNPHPDSMFSKEWRILRNKIQAEAQKEFSGNYRDNLDVNRKILAAKTNQMIWDSKFWEEIYPSTHGVAP